MNFACKHCGTATRFGKLLKLAKAQGFFFLNRPPRASIGLFVFCCCCCGEALACEPAPKQLSCDFSMPAATPPTSGINFGSDVVPLIWNGSVGPLPPLAFLQLPKRPPAAPPAPPVTFPSRPPRASEAAPVAAPPAPPMAFFRVAAILKSQLFLASIVPLPTSVPND